MRGTVAIQEGSCLQKDDFKLFAEYIISTCFESSNVSLFENIFFHNNKLSDTLVGENLNQ